jgi:hypothetical protein
MLLPRLYGELGEVDVEELDRTITAGGEKLVLMRFGPRDVEERVLGVEPEERTLSDYIHTNRACDDGRESAHHFSATIPFGVRPSMYTRPLPTRPKFADAATAMRESKKGEYLTL